MGRGSTHHFALNVGSEEELSGWRDYLRLARHPGHRGARPRRTSSRSTCATPTATSSSSPARAPGSRPTSRSRSSAGARCSAGGRTARSGRRRSRHRPQAAVSTPAPSWAACSAPAGAFFAVKHRGERQPLALGQRARPACSRDTPSDTSSLLQRVRPQRFWLISRSLIDMLCACQGQLSTTSAAESSPARDPTLHSSSGEPYAVGVLQRPQMLFLTSVDRCRLAHQTSPALRANLQADAVPRRPGVRLGRRSLKPLSSRASTRNRPGLSLRAAFFWGFRFVRKPTREGPGAGVPRLDGVCSVAMRSTSIVATIGPASQEPAVLEAMIAAGMDVARLNFAHGTPELHAETAADIRAASERVGREVAILGDLPGPKLRIGPVAGGVAELARDSRVVLTPGGGRGHERAAAGRVAGLLRAGRRGRRLLPRRRRRAPARRRGRRAATSSRASRWAAASPRARASTCRT